MSAEKINELLPNDFKVTPIEGIQAVFITAVKSDSWLTYKSDDDPIKKFVLKKGRSLLFRAKEARVFLGNLGAVKIFLNNKPLIVKSRTGVKSLVFPQENAGNYMMPLFIYKEDGSVQTSQEWIEKNQ
jgi:cytoskeleton protein RodZ